MRTRAKRSHEQRVERNTRAAISAALVLSAVLGFVTVGGVVTHNPTIFPPQSPPPAPALHIPTPRPSVTAVAPSRRPQRPSVRTRTPVPLLSTGVRASSPESPGSPRPVGRPSRSPSRPSPTVVVRVQVTPSPDVQVCVPNVLCIHVVKP